jgi:hypothetical protein
MRHLDKLCIINAAMLQHYKRKTGRDARRKPSTGLLDPTARVDAFYRGYRINSVLRADVPDTMPRRYIGQSLKTLYRIIKNQPGFHAKVMKRHNVLRP